MRILMLLLFHLVCFFSNAQFVTTNIGPEGETLFNIGSATVNKIKPDDVEGSPLLADEWAKGYIKLRNNKQINGVFLQYNLERGILYFSKDSNSRFEFTDRILEFSFPSSAQNATEQFLFRSNYPQNGTYNDFTFYRVMGEGTKLQFLNHCYKIIQENFGFDKNYKRVYQLKQEWFIYNVEMKSFHPVSNKKSILAALPRYKEQIEALCSKYKWSLKTEQQIAQLVKEIK